MSRRHLAPYAAKVVFAEKCLLEGMTPHETFAAMKKAKLVSTTTNFCDSSIVRDVQERLKQSGQAPKQTKLDSDIMFALSLAGKCRNCGHKPTLVKREGKKRYPWLLMHTHSTCPAMFGLMAEKDTAEDCIAAWNLHNRTPTPKLWQEGDPEPAPRVTTLTPRKGLILVVYSTSNNFRARYMFVDSIRIRRGREYMTWKRAISHARELYACCHQDELEWKIVDATPEDKNLSSEETFTKEMEKLFDEDGDDALDE